MKSESQEFVITVGKDAKETCTTPKPGAEQESKPEGSPAEPAPAPGKPDDESKKPEAPKDPKPGKPAPGKPEKPGAPEGGKKPESPKDPDKQSTPGSSSPQGFFSNFNPVHLLAPVLGIAFIARMVALFFELQPQVANFFAQNVPGLPKWGK